MMHRRTRVLAAGFWFASLAVSAASAQAPGRKPAEREGQLSAPKLDENDKKTLGLMQSGKEVIDDDKKKLLEKAAKHYLYNFTDPSVQFKPYQDGATVGNESRIRSEREALFKHIAVPEGGKPLREEQKAYVRAFAKALEQPIKTVIKNEKPIARVNAAMVLARLGETGLEEVAGLLCEVVADPENDDAVKLFALEGLKNLFKGERSKDANGEIVFQRARFKNEDAEFRCVRTLVDFLKRKPAGLNPAAPSEEVDAFRWVRREAIRALGAIRFSTIHGAGVQLYPALELLRVLANPQDMEPKPSLSEQLEAAIGLCQVQPRLTGDRPTYQADYAAAFVGRFVTELADRYNAERGEAGSAFDWKFAAYRLSEALSEMRADAKGRAKPYVEDVVKRSLPIFKNMQDGVQADPVGLGDWLGAHKPQSAELFKGVTESELKAVPPPPK